MTGALATSAPRMRHRTADWLQIAISILFSFGAEHDGSAGNCSAKDAAQKSRLIANCHFYTVQLWGGAWRECWQLQRQRRRTERQIDCKLPFLMFSFGVEHDGIMLATAVPRTRTDRQIDCQLPFLYCSVLGQSMTAVLATAAPRMQHRTADWLQIVISILFSFGAEHDLSAGNCSTKDVAQNGRLIANCHFNTVQFWGGAWRECWQLQHQGRGTERQIDCKLPFLMFSFGVEHDGIMLATAAPRMQHRTADWLQIAISNVQFWGGAWRECWQL